MNPIPKSGSSNLKANEMEAKLKSFQIEVILEDNKVKTEVTIKVKPKQQPKSKK